MGLSSSKTAKAASSVAKRKYPQQASVAATNTSPRPPPERSTSVRDPTVHPQSGARQIRDSRTHCSALILQYLANSSEAVNLDASDPHFAASLRSLGPVTPSSTLSNSSRFPSSPDTDSSTSSLSPSHQNLPNPSQNPAIQVLTARESLANEAEAEFARVRYEGGGSRRFVDVMTIRQILMFRDGQKMGNADIENKLGLAAGTVGRLGGQGVIGEAGMTIG